MDISKWKNNSFPAKWPLSLDWMTSCCISLESAYQDASFDVYLSSVWFFSDFKGFFQCSWSNGLSTWFPQVLNLPYILDPKLTNNIETVHRYGIWPVNRYMYGLWVFFTYIHTYFVHTWWPYSSEWIKPCHVQTLIETQHLRPIIWYIHLI